MDLYAMLGELFGIWHLANCNAEKDLRDFESVK